MTENKQMKNAYLDIFQASASNIPMINMEVFAVSILKRTLSKEICKIQIFGTFGE
jgi:hypothetical protein